jgi:hypothetical protein|tara:strand:+ start:1822 stop:2640 length:819 start_codon:yes stop_codon:yes gene_type:complete
MKILVLGENSRLTKSLVNISKTPLIVVKKEIYENWFDDATLILYLKNIGFSNNDSIIITKSIINPNYDFNEVNKWNFLFQKNIIQILELHSIKANVFFTGSIFEKTLVKNNYLDSKRNLSNYILTNEFSSVTPLVIRLHTLYGIGDPPSNMFLGQIFTSLKNKTKFNMSDGNQVRQYHHYNEVSSFLLNIVSGSKLNVKIIDFTGNEWVKLKDLANSIYNYFNCLELLNIGSLKKSKNEIIKTENQFISNGDFQFKNPLISINKYLEKSLNE